MTLDQASNEPFTTTVTYPDFPAFAQRARILPRPKPTVRAELGSVVRLVREATHTRLLLLDSTSGRIHPDLLSAILIGFLPRKRRPVIVFMGAMWQKDTGLPGLVQRAMIKLADRAVTRYAVQSTDEIPLFSDAWNIPRSKLRSIPYFYTFTAKDLAAPAPAPEGFIFAGGNSHRDYDSYLEAVRMLPEHQFVIASRLLDGKALPPNVRAGEVPRGEFIRLMRAAAAVVVPLRRDLIRATGQQTYLNAMMLGKPTIVTNTLGVCDYIHADDLALVVDGSPEGYVRAIGEVFGPDNRENIARLTSRARETVLQKFTFENHAACLVAVLDEAFRDASPA